METIPKSTILSNVKRDIWKYEKERNALRRKYGKDYRHNAEYAQSVAGITERLNAWYKKKRRLEKWYGEMKVLAKQTAMFFEVRTIRDFSLIKPVAVAGGLTELERRVAHARWFFSKVAIERLHLQSRFVGDFLGMESIEYATRVRIDLNKRLKTDKTMVELWHKYKRFITKNDHYICVQKQEQQQAA